MPDRFEGKVVVITGAAGGIGRATAVRFASEGANILAVDLPNSDLDETVAAVQRAGGQIATYPADVTVASDVDGYFQSALDQFGQIDVFFNKAGCSSTRRASMAGSDRCWITQSTNSTAFSRSTSRASSSGCRQ